MSENLQTNKIELDVTLPLQKTEAGWRVHLENKFVNAICGNMFAEPEAYSKEIQERMDAATEKMQEQGMQAFWGFRRRNRA